MYSTDNSRLPDALRPYEPATTGRWSRSKVAHLYRRAAFGATWGELEEGLRLGPQACIDRLLTGTEGGPISEQDFAAIARTAIAAGSDRNLQGWWLFRMLAGGHPLRERMTLFWHDHFATSQEKVGNLALMQQQNELFRRHALGRFWDRESGGLLLAISRDPAMLIWLDSNSNRRSAPNENFAREIMELFALGIGNYSEKDIREAARAFTGWFVNRNQFRFVESEHDGGSKTVLGQTGRWDGADVVRIVADQGATADFIVTKLYRRLVNESFGLAERPAMDSDWPAIAPADEAAAVSELAAGFRAREYDLQWLIETMLRSRLFFSQNAYRCCITSPVDFTVATVRRLEGSRVSPVVLAELCSKLGQTLFHPPNVAGWEGGRAWINSSTLVARANFAKAIVELRNGPFAGRVDPVSLAAAYSRKTARDVTDFYLELLVDGQVPPETRAQLVDSLATSSRNGNDMHDARVRQLVQLILCLPEYNLC